MSDIGILKSYPVMGTRSNIGAGPVFKCASA